MRQQHENDANVVKQTSTTALNAARVQITEPPRQNTLAFTQTEDPTIKAPFKNTLKVARQPQRAAMGSNDPMNKQAQQSIPNMGAINASGCRKWVKPKPHGAS